MKILSLFLAAVVSLAGVASAGSDSTASNWQTGPTKVAITVDDIPEDGDLIPGTSREEISRGILGVFKENGVDHAYGFSNGTFMDDAPGEIEILKQWLIAGYSLGNHTYSHPNLDDVSARRYIADIAKQDRLLETLSTFSPLIQKRRIFRYPFLDEGNTLAKRDAVRAYLTRNGYRIAQVTLDYSDWAWADAYRRCVAKHDNRSIQWLKDHVGQSADHQLLVSEKNAKLLFHRDIPQILLIHLSWFNSLTLHKILENWREHDVQFVSLDEALSDPVYAINPNLSYAGGLTFLEQIAESRKIDITPDDPTYSTERLNQICK